MPRAAIETMEKTLAAIPDDDRQRERRKRIEAWVDAGHGSCFLRRPEVAGIIYENWRHFSGERYDLGPWVIMPNHIHVLIRVRPGTSLETIIRSWKSYTAKRIMAVTGATAPIWLDDYWDHFIRDESHWMNTRAYIERNPVTAGLVADPADWPWSSASKDRSWDRAPLARSEGGSASGGE